MLQTRKLTQKCATSKNPQKKVFRGRVSKKKVCLPMLFFCQLVKNEKNRIIFCPSNSYLRTMPVILTSRGSITTTILPMHQVGIKTIQKEAVCIFTKHKTNYTVLYKIYPLYWGGAEGEIILFQFSQFSYRFPFSRLNCSSPIGTLVPSSPCSPTP